MEIEVFGREMSRGVLGLPQLGHVELLPGRVRSLHVAAEEAANAGLPDRLASDGVGEDVVRRRWR